MLLESAWYAEMTTRAQMLRIVPPNTRQKRETFSSLLFGGLCVGWCDGVEALRAVSDANMGNSCSLLSFRSSSRANRPGLMRGLLGCATWTKVRGNSNGSRGLQEQEEAGRLIAKSIMQADGRHRLRFAIVPRLQTAGRLRHEGWRSWCGRP